ncbi:type II toxin-antitoxin system RelE/ParE family toxin [Chlorogloeopsis sp. ULAP02]|uniref:type II toxin-antitoxin system RelE/ParE family toxin n=1 Tax=Chlorogloeopsis sp. ULAP02 TaxID=3107926 RepID=UPI00313707D3
MDFDQPQPSSVEYAIELISLALEMLAGIKDWRQQQALSDQIDKLKTEPEKQGKLLVDKLKDYRSVRAVSQRCRIIYKVELEKVVVLVVGVGLGKEGDKSDIYSLMQKLLEE